MKIIDVSQHQGVIDWKSVKQSGVTDVIIRLSLGYGTIDKNAVMNSKGAADAGLSVSYYHFAYPDSRPGTIDGDAKQEAGFFCDQFGDGKLPAPKWLVVDLEKWDNEGKDSPLKPADYYRWLQIFLREVLDRTGIVPFIYSYKSYLDAHLPKDHKLGAFPLWIANYTTGLTTPPLPNGWTQYFIWQNTSKGKISGISTSVDGNKLFVNEVLNNLP